MGDLKLFRLGQAEVSEIAGSSLGLEKSLQTLMERNLEALLGVRFLATEFSTGPAHGGRMDTLGVDENGCPVIIEYKRQSNQNIINQGLFYLDWLLDHRKDFEWLVMEKYGRSVADNVQWSSPRLLCIAGDFNRYDEYAVKQMDRNIELIRYRRYGDDLLLLELVNATSAPPASHQPVGINAPGPAPSSRYKTVSEHLAQAPPELLDLYESLRAYLTALGDDVQEKTLDYYVAFKRIKNFACVELRITQMALKVFVKVDPDTVALENGFTRDVRKIGHFGTGDLEITIATAGDLERAKPLLERSYERS